MAAKRNLIIEQGATFRPPSWTWKAGTPKTPVDLTGCQARMQVRAKMDTDVLLELTTENSRIVLGGVAGTIQLEVSAADTNAITWKGGIYDLEIVFADGRVRRLLYGSVSVSPGVTRE